MLASFCSLQGVISYHCMVSLCIIMSNFLYFISKTWDGWNHSPLGEHFSTMWGMIYRKSSHRVSHSILYKVQIQSVIRQYCWKVYRCNTRNLLRQLHRYSLSGNVSPDRVHMLISALPHLSISKIVQYIKGKSSRKLQSAFQAWHRTTGFQPVGYLFAIEILFLISLCFHYGAWSWNSYFCHYFYLLVLYHSTQYWRNPSWWLAMKLFSRFFFYSLFRC